MSLDQQLKLLSRSIDPAVLGRRIRNARLVAGLTQAEVGYPNASAAYICRIEAGQRRPGVALLAHVAERTGTSIEALLLGIERDRLDELRLALSRADLLLASGRITAASAMASRVSDEIASVQVPELASSAQRIRALAMLEAGRAAAAAELIEELIEENPMSARILQLHTSLVRCHLLEGDFERAVEVGERAMTLVDQFGLQGLPEALELVIAIADVHVKLGREDEARKLCQQGLEAAADLVDGSQLGTAYWHASTTESRRGATALARRHAERAIGLLELDRFRANIVSLRDRVEDLQPAPAG
jgi:tetratricopeptide (TPR) repeat protein